MKAPGTLTEWVRIYILHGWTNHDELVNISKELLEHMGPVKLDEIIREAERQKAEYEGDDAEMLHKRQADFYGGSR